MPPSITPAAAAEKAPPAPPVIHVSRTARLLELLFAAAVLVLLATVVLPVGWSWWSEQGPVQTTDDAYVQGDFRALAARVPGYVTAVLVQDYQTVKAGQPLLEIEADDYQAKVDLARADLQARVAAVQIADASLRQQQNIIGEAASQVDVTESDLVLARVQLGRARSLLRTPAGTQSDVDETTARFSSSTATLASNQAALALARGQLEVLAAQRQQAEAEVSQAAASLKLAQIDLDHTVIRAPVDGRLGRRAVFTGQFVAAGTGVITITPLNSVWVAANFRETQLTNMRAGQPATVRIDSFPGEVLHGQVDTMSPASGGVTALLPPDNATGNFTKIVQRIPVKIRLDPQETLSGRLLPGMSAVVRVDVAQTRTP
jgi:membrane fusion protein, multidrug efflux system